MQQNECALTYKISRSKRYEACSDMYHRNSIDACRTWGPTQWGGAFAPYKRFVFGKTLAQGRLCRPRALK